MEWDKLRSLSDGKIVSLESILSKNINVSYRCGCDSMNIRDKTIFITTLVGIRSEGGAFVLYQKDKAPKISDIQERLWKEVERAISFAVYFRDNHPMKLEGIDFDLNTDEQFISSRLASSAIGYANSLGFEAQCKPSMLCAIYASDHVVHNGSEYSKHGIL